MKIFDYAANALGPVEALATLGTGMMGASYGGLAGLGRLATGGTPLQASDTIRNVQEALTYTPRTRAGRRLTGDIASGIERAGEAITDVVPPLSGEWRGEKALGLTGSPLVAAAAETADPMDLLGGAGKVAPAIFLGARAGRRLASQGDTSVQRAFQMAENMESRGLSAQRIWDATKEFFRREGVPWVGVHRGDDGQWRFEVPDEAAVFDTDELYRYDVPSNQQTTFTGKLQDIMQHPDLYRAAPELADMDISVNPEYQGFRGAFDPRDFSMTVLPVNYKGMGTVYLGNKMPESVVLHETQHAAQNMERFDPGGNTSMYESPDPEDTFGKLMQMQANLESLPNQSPTVKRAHDEIDMFYGIVDDAEHSQEMYNIMPGEAEAAAVEGRWEAPRAERPSDRLRVPENLRGRQRPHPFYNMPSTQAERQAVRTFKQEWNRIMNIYKSAMKAGGAGGGTKPLP